MEYQSYHDATGVNKVCIYNMIACVVRSMGALSNTGIGLGLAIPVDQTVRIRLAPVWWSRSAIPSPVRGLVF